MIEILRQWDQLGNCRLTIERHGEWDVALQQQGTNKVVRGTGPTFAEAWDRIDIAPARLTGDVGRTYLMMSGPTKRYFGFGNADDFVVLDGRRVIGCIMLQPQAPEGRPWFWTIALDSQSRLLSDPRTSDGRI